MTHPRDTTRAKNVEAAAVRAPNPDLGFVASTGRTATMFLAKTLNDIPGVAAFHEGHVPGESPTPRLPLINLHNRQAWYDPTFARQTVSERRNPATLSEAAGDADLVVDIAFYNAPLLAALAEQHPASRIAAMFRRCEGFVRSATIMSGEDLQPAGWPDPAKPLTDRERFIEMGRLRPAPGTEAAEAWSAWSGIERNIWLWHEVNSHLAATVDEIPHAGRLFFEDLVGEPRRFWAQCLTGLGIDRPDLIEWCVERSNERINARPEYQVGPAAAWSATQRTLYEGVALPLERRIYGDR